MISRLLFLLIAGFWVTMNLLLWRAEYDSHGAGVRVPVALVWQKILTAPDVSSLNVYQGNRETGFCEFSTQVEQEMAALDESDVVPRKISARAGYQIRFDGNVGLGNYTNRLVFNGQIEFSRQRQWREINLRLSSNLAVIKLHSLAAEQNVHLDIASDGVTNEMVIRFAELQNPNTVWRALMGNLGEWATGLDLPLDLQTPADLAQNIRWEARLDRLRLGGESVPAYRLETRILDQTIDVYVSTLGEILRIDLPGGVIASFDRLGNP